MTARRAAVLVAAGALLLGGCTDDAATDGGPTATAAAASPGPLVAADGPVAPLSTTAVFRIGVSDAGTPAVVYEDPTDTSVVRSTRIGLGADPTAAPVTPVDVESGNLIGSLQVDDDGTLTALAVLNGDEAFGLHVLRVAADGTQRATRVPDAGIGTLTYATTDAVSDDGTTAVVASTDRGGDDPGAVDRVVVTTVDLAAARVTGRAEADLGTDVAVEPRAVRIGPDGAVTVLVGAAPGAASSVGASLVRFGPGGAPAHVVGLDPTARFDTSRLDLAPDGTAVVSLQPAGDLLTTRVLTVAPGSDAVVPVADLASTAVQTLVAGPDGWVHLDADRYGAGPTSGVVLPLDLAGGETADPVEVCPDPGDDDAPDRAPDGASDGVLGLTRSGSGSPLLAWVSCGRGDSRLVVLESR